jgi:quinol monooxygenase YgiN
MPTGTVRVVLRLTAQPGKVEQLKSVLLELAAQSRKENGCTGYEVLQNPADTRDFTAYEAWTNEAALDAHMMTPHVQHAFAVGVPLLAGAPDRRVYTAIN